jgi:biofilm PGA synthesis N-glycosyltransferase PgaC
MAIPMHVVRAGRRIVFEPKALGFEQGSETAREELARKTRVIAGAVQFLQRRDSWVPLRSPQVIVSLISHKGLRWFSPAFATCALVSSAVLASASYGYAAAVTGQLVFLALGLAGCAPALRKFALIGVAHYFCLTQTAAAAGFVRGLTRRQSVLWQRFDRTSRPVPLAYSK